MLDAYGGLEPQLAAYREARRAHEALRRKRLELIQAAHGRQRQRALLEFERDELAEADPRAGEYDELSREAHRLANAEQLRIATGEGYALLYEADRSAQGLLERVARLIEPIARSVPELEATVADLDRLADETREAAYTLRDLGRGWDDDPARLEEIEARLALYRRLATRFHCTADDLAARRAEVDAELAAIERDESDLSGLDAPLTAAWAAVKAAARQLSSCPAEVVQGVRPRDPGAAQAARPRPAPS